QKRVIVHFPASRDVMWHRAPKFAKGQTGLFFLHKAPAAATAAKGVRSLTPPPPGAYTALDPDDYQPPSAAPAVEAMMPAAGGAPARQKAAVKRAVSKRGKKRNS